MPTPSEDVYILPSSPPPTIASARATCPSDDSVQFSLRAEESTEGYDSDEIMGVGFERSEPQQRHSNSTVSDDDGPLIESPSSSCYVEETPEYENYFPDSSSSTCLLPAYSSDFTRLPFPRTRFLPNSTSSFLRPGSKFRGTQQSDCQVYDVHVEIKHVDMSESFLCGYLRIQGLTDDHPTLTTYFEGEIIGTKHTFLTRHSEWGSNEMVDMQHWGRFSAWRPFAKLAKRPEFTYKNFAQRENLFMRWKELFLVPDHRVRSISGASYDGFYYICFNQVTGAVSGIYFHAKSERYQQLELEHIDDRGCVGAMEFR